MKLTSAPVNSESNHKGEEFKGRLNTAKLGMFMQQLIRNYNYPELATLREWVSNAHDSHVKAGQTKPVKITLPTKLSNTLVVEDFGAGMSYEDVRDTYAVFLTSTKDQDNDGIGGFGIGGKSALALADQYTMVTVKDGLKNIFIFERSDEGGLAVKPVVKDSPTELPSGVKVSVALNNGARLDHARANRVLQGWRAEELEVVGGTFTSIFDDALEFEHGVTKSNVFTSEEKSQSGSFRVLVGPVAYEVPNSFYLERSLGFLQHFGYASAVKLNIGDVTVPSSREVIEDTKANHEAIARAAAAFEKEIQAHVDDLVKSLGSFKAAYEFANSSFATRTGLPVVHEGRNLNKISYKGKFFSASLYAQDMKLMKLSDTELSSKKVDMVVKLTKEEFELTDDTQKKYIRDTVFELWDKKRASNNTIGHYNYYARRASEFIALLTFEDDPLYEITAPVFDYAELKKTAKLPKKSSSVRYSKEERISRVGNFVNSVPVENKKDQYTYLKNSFFKDHPAFSSEEPLIAFSSGSSFDLVSFMAGLFDVRDRLVVLENKSFGRSVLSVFPKGKLFSDFLKELPEEAKDSARKKFKKARKLQEQLGLRGSDQLHIQRVLESGLLDEEAKKFLAMENVTLACTMSNALNSTESLAVKELKTILELPTYVQLPRRPKDPFAMLDLNVKTSELAAYLNWAIGRYNSDPKAW